MYKKCLLLIAMLSVLLCSLTACVPEKDNFPTTTTATTTTTTVTTTTTTVTTTTTTASATKSTNGSTNLIMQSPFADVTIKAITAYDKENQYATDGKVLVAEKETDIDDIQKIQAWLNAEDWQYYATTESGWVKIQPIHAKRVVTFALDNGKQLVLHLMSDTGSWVAVGTFDGALDYTAIYNQAWQADKTGNQHFMRYHISKTCVSKIIAELFDN